MFYSTFSLMRKESAKTMNRKKYEKLGSATAWRTQQMHFGPISYLSKTPQLLLFRFAHSSSRCSEGVAGIFLPQKQVLV